MKRMVFKVILPFFFIVSSLQVCGQDRVLQGVVTTFDSIPVNGATIKVRSTKYEVQSDSLGQFTVGCNFNDKLKVSGNGFYTINVEVENNTKLVAVNLKLKPGEKSKELALGLTNVADHDKLNALATLNSNDIDFSKYRTMEEAISGRIPGVRFASGGIIVRESYSVSVGGNTYALIVVDGVSSNYGALSKMNPSDVKSISVIKDGSAAMYGSRGASGVIVIETKTGRDSH